MTLAALQRINSKALNSFLLLAADPQIGSAYVIDSKMTLKYRSKSVFQGKKIERLIRCRLLTILVGPVWLHCKMSAHLSG